MCANDRTIGRVVPPVDQRSENSLTESVSHRVLLFGGTFDPPHVGHLAMAQFALEQLDVNEVWWLPAPSPPHKTGMPMPGFDIRLRMVETLIAGMSGQRVATLEGALPSPSHTVTTVTQCQKWFPHIEFTFLLGSDSLAQLATWHQAATLTERISFAVAARSGFPYERVYQTAQQALPELRAVCVEMPLLDISSTWIRNRLSTGQSVCKLVPDEVLSHWSEWCNEIYKPDGL